MKNFLPQALDKGFLCGIYTIMVTIPITDNPNAKPTLRLTRQRRLILQALRSSKTHPTADELYEMVREKLPHISLGTVYRNLEIMASSGIIRKLETAGTQKRFDGILEDHYHVRCVRCGRVDDLPVKSIKAVDDAVIGVTDYQILSHHLEFAGLCPRCQK